jgi:DeoR family transcriptional regulator of aga operon
MRQHARPLGVQVLDHDKRESSIERQMVAHTRGEVIVLADRSKIGTVADVVICKFDQVDAVMVDAGVDDEFRAEIRRLGLRCIAV